MNTDRVQWKKKEIYFTYKNLEIVMCGGFFYYKGSINWIVNLDSKENFTFTYININFIVLSFQWLSVLDW